MKTLIGRQPNLLLSNPRVVYKIKTPARKPIGILARMLQTSQQLLRSCKQPSELHQIHAHFIKTGLDVVPFPASNLLAAAASLAVSDNTASYARSIFDRIPTPNLFQFNTMLRAYSIQSSFSVDEPISLFNSLRSRRIPLDQFSFIPTLKICARSRAARTAVQLHAAILSSGFHRFLNLRNTLIHLYCACSRPADARQIFDEIPALRDPVSWSALMGGYLHASQPLTVLALFRDMLSSASCNAAAIVNALSASVADCTGEALHGYCTKTGFVSADLNVATAVATMYSKSDRMCSARTVFDDMPRRDVVLYNCMVDGYARGGFLEESLGLLQRMRGEGVRPNSATLVGLLSACAAEGALAIGRRVREYAEEENLVLDGALGTAAVDMYLKSGYVEEAAVVFNRMQKRDVKAWTAMIMGLGAHGRAETALQLFCEMEEQGVKPNEVTFLAVLSACSHRGLVSLGRDFFERMVREYGLSPGIEHYGCVIDLLGRAGMLEEAHELIKSLPLEGDAMAWRALLSACRICGDVKLGEVARKALVALGDEHPTDSILLSSTYGFAGMSEDFKRMGEYSRSWKTMSKKEAGCSSIDLGT